MPSLKLAPCLMCYQYFIKSQIKLFLMFPGAPCQKLMLIFCERQAWWNKCKNQCHLSPGNYSRFQTSERPDASRVRSQSPHPRQRKMGSKKIPFWSREILWLLKDEVNEIGPFLNDSSFFKTLNPKTSYNTIITLCSRMVCGRIARGTSSQVM